MKRTTSQTNTKQSTRHGGVVAEQGLATSRSRRAASSHAASWGGGFNVQPPRLTLAGDEATSVRRSPARHSDPFGGLFAANKPRALASARGEDASDDRDGRGDRSVSRSRINRDKSDESRGRLASVFGAARSPRTPRSSRSADTGRSGSGSTDSAADRNAFHVIRPSAHRIESDGRGASERERKKRQRAKARADKMFDRQMATSSRAADAEQAEGAPRAAVYETKMGALHRRSARLQKASQAGPASARVNPAGWFAGLRVNPRIAAAVTAVTCAMLVAVFLYMPARDYYQAQRQHDRLATEYAQIEERNQALNDQNQVLSSDAGMEDAVRRKYGYVVEGEDSAVVTGLSDRTMESIREAADVQANVLSSSVKPTDEWYTPYLDAFFGVS